MPYIARNPEAFLSSSVGTGQCVALAERAAMAPRTQFWRRGKKVRGAHDVQRGTIIATFDPSGCYGNHTDGRSHAAIYLGQTGAGIEVIDQWVDVSHGVHRPHPASRRVIRFRGGHGVAVNDGDQYYVVI
jgi:hypothetical protein